MPHHWRPSLYLLILGKNYAMGFWKKDSNNTVLDVLLLKQKVFDFNQEFSFDRVWYKWTGLGLEIVKEEYWKVSHLCSETCTLGPYYLLKTRSKTVLLCCFGHKCQKKWSKRAELALRGLKFFACRFKDMKHIILIFSISSN